MRQVLWTLAFLLFDREAGRVRPGPVTGLAVAALTVAGHLWLSGQWLEKAGFAVSTHPPAALRSSPPPIASCSAEAHR